MKKVAKAGIKEVLPFRVSLIIINEYYFLLPIAKETSPSDRELLDFEDEDELFCREDLVVKGFGELTIYDFHGYFVRDSQRKIFPLFLSIMIPNFELFFMRNDLLRVPARRILNIETYCTPLFFNMATDEGDGSSNVVMTRRRLDRLVEMWGNLRSFQKTELDCKFLGILSKHSKLEKINGFYVDHSKGFENIELQLNEFINVLKSGFGRLKRLMLSVESPFLDDEVKMGSKEILKCVRDRDDNIVNLENLRNLKVFNFRGLYAGNLYHSGMIAKNLKELYLKRVTLNQHFFVKIGEFQSLQTVVIDEFHIVTRKFVRGIFEYEENDDEEPVWDVDGSLKMIPFTKYVTYNERDIVYDITGIFNIPALKHLCFLNSSAAFVDRLLGITHNMTSKMKCTVIEVFEVTYRQCLKPSGMNNMVGIMGKLVGKVFDEDSAKKIAKELISCFGNSIFSIYVCLCSARVSIFSKRNCIFQNINKDASEMIRHWEMKKNEKVGSTNFWESMEFKCCKFLDEETRSLKSLMARCPRELILKRCEVGNEFFEYLESCMCETMLLSQNVFPTYHEQRLDNRIRSFDCAPTLKNLKVVFTELETGLGQEGWKFFENKNFNSFENIFLKKKECFQIDNDEIIFVSGIKTNYMGSIEKKIIHPIFQNVKKLYFEKCLIDKSVIRFITKFERLENVNIYCSVFSADGEEEFKNLFFSLNLKNLSFLYLNQSKLENERNEMKLFQNLINNFQSVRVVKLRVVNLVGFSNIPLQFYRKLRENMLNLRFLYCSVNSENEKKRIHDIFQNSKCRIQFLRKWINSEKYSSLN